MHVHMCVCMYVYVYVCVCIYIYIICGLGSSVGIATDYELDSPGSNPCGDEIFRPSRPALGTVSFPGVKCSWGVPLTTHPLGHGHGRVELYLYLPSGPHQACNGNTLPLPLYIYIYIYVCVCVCVCSCFRWGTCVVRFINVL